LIAARAALAALAIAALSNPQIRAPFKSDPPAMCDSCPRWNADFDPFRIFGNTYYVGTAGLSSVLVTSESGHILLDGGLPQSAEEIDRHVRRLGFRIEDVRLIVVSHAHVDHVGGIHALQHASRAVVAASPSSARALKQGLPTSDDPQYGFMGEFPRVPKVRVVRDGETLRVGSLPAITAHFTPGHTPGSTTWTWESCEGARCLHMVYADSLNAVVGPGFKYSSDLARVAAFRASLAAVAALPCDIVISVHPDFTDVAGKLARRDGGDADAFVNPQSCREYAEANVRLLDRQLASERDTEQR
jgi:metallo-beta-lactamase class B